MGCRFGLLPTSIRRARQSRLWNAGGPAGLAALEARNAAERQAQLRQRAQRLRPQDPCSQLDNEIIFLCEDDEDDANEASPTIQFIFPEDDTNGS
jgi:hypothetical protein